MRISTLILRLIILIAAIVTIIPFMLLVFEAMDCGRNSFLYRLIENE